MPVSVRDTASYANIINNKKRMFLAMFFLFMFNKTFVPLFIATRVDVSTGMNVSGTLMAMAMCGTAMLITLSMKTHRIYHSSVITIFITCIFLYVFYAVIMSYYGLFVFSGIKNYKNILAFTAGSITLFLSARIVIEYDIKLEFVKAVCLALGIGLATAYILHFDNLAVLDHLGDLFDNAKRYRYAFGLGHPNQAGHDAMDFLIYCSLYRTLAKEKGRYSAANDMFNVLFLIPVSGIAFIVLLSTASRAAMTGIILFFMAYFFLTFRTKIGGHIWFLVSMAAVVLAYFVVVTVDWDYVFKESNRMENYITISVMLQKDVWLTGLGFIGDFELEVFADIRVLDSYYLCRFIQSGLIGFIIHIGTILWFAKKYFQHSAGMTRFQRLAGSLLTVCLYYGLFEAVLFSGTPIEVVNWVLFLIAMNQMSEVQQKHTQRRAKS